MLKTQFQLWKAEYGFLPIQPRAGDLWLIPGYVPHAVMPRTLTPPDALAKDDEAETPAPTTASPEMDQTLRMSVACNIFRDSSNASKEPEAIGAMRALLHSVM